MTGEPLHLLACLLIKIGCPYILGSNCHPVHRIRSQACNGTTVCHTNASSRQHSATTAAKCDCCMEIHAKFNLTRTHSWSMKGKLCTIHTHILCEYSCNSKITIPVIVCLQTPGFTVRTSTLLTHTTCWWLLLLGNQEMMADVLVTWLAFTLLGPKGVSLPMTIVHAASRDVRLLGVMERTLIRCGCSKHVKY